MSDYQNEKIMEVVEPIPCLSAECLPADANNSEFVQWSILGNDMFYPCKSTMSTLKSGLYDVVYSSIVSDIVLKKVPINTDELYVLPTPEIEEILSDIKSFWKKSDKFKLFNLVHKRGILLYGDPGCGKSGILQLVMKHLIEELDGLVINIKDPDSFNGFSAIITQLRQIEPERPITVIIEDIDAIMEYSSNSSAMLNLLDGVKQIENVVYLATTNYPEKLEERITNRPSRFDRRYLINPPSREVRKVYLERKMEGKDTGIAIDIEKWLDDTEGLSMSHLKELFISVVLLDIAYENAIDHLNGMKKKPRNKITTDLGFGSK